MKARWQRFTTSINNFSFYDWLAVALVVIAAILRFYNLEATQQFLGDQGRDAMVVSQIFLEGDPVFIGPVTSLGNMYLGPLYYYFMLPFLWLSYPSPMGPIYAVALLGTITVGLVYFVGKRLFSPRAAVIATSFFTFSSALIIYTRFSWNPNPAPLLALLMAYFTYLAWRKNGWYWVAVALMFSILIQLHYVTLLTGAAAGIIWLVALGTKLRHKKAVKKMLVSTLVGGAVVLISLTPLILFDLKHQGLNIKAFRSIFTTEQAFEVGQSTGMTAKLMEWFGDLRSRANLIWTDLHFGKNSWRNPVLLLSFITGGAWLVSLRKQFKQAAKRREFYAAVVLLVYLLTTIISMAFYSHDVFTHYIIFVFPVVFLLFGGLADYIWRQNKYLGLVVVVTALAAFMNYNFAQISFKAAGWQISDISRTADTIAERVKPGEKYTIVLVSETGDILGQNYRYFLNTKEGKEPVDRQVEDDFSKLFIINEAGQEDVLDLPIYEIVIVPDKEPVEVYQVPDGPEIIVLENQ